MNAELFLQQNGFRVTYIPVPDCTSFYGVIVAMDGEQPETELMYGVVKRYLEQLGARETLIFLNKRFKRGFEYFYDTESII